MTRRQWRPEAGVPVRDPAAAMASQNADPAAVSSAAARKAAEAGATAARGAVGKR